MQLTNKLPATQVGQLIAELAEAVKSLIHENQQLDARLMDSGRAVEWQEDDYCKQLSSLLELIRRPGS